MKNVEPLGLFPVVHRSHHRIDEGLYCAVTQSQDHGPPIQILKRPCLRSLKRFPFQSMHHAVSLQSQCRIDHVTDKAEDHRHLVANPVNNQTENNNTDGEGPNPRPKKLLTLNRVEAEVFRPKPRIVYQKRTRDKRECCSD